MDSLFLFGAVLGGEWLVVLGDQAVDLAAEQHHHLRGPRLGRLHFALAVYLAFFFTADVGVVALFLIVFEVVFGHLLDDRSDLILAQCETDEQVSVVKILRNVFSSDE